jgi:peptidoglycan/LPS O-acetylase OafA/YrhL
MISKNRIVQHIDFLDGLRALAALFVLLSHIWYQVWPAVFPPFGYGQRPTGLTLVFTSWLYYGHFSVVVFIVLSGFCLMLPVIQNNGILGGGALQFFKRRARRILPPYYFALFISLLLISFLISSKTGSQWDISLPVTQDGILAHLLMLQDIVSTTQINYVFWSIALEFHLYLFFPVFVICWQRFGSIKTTLFAGLFIYTTIFILEMNDFNEIPPQFIGLCFYFVLGMLGSSIVFSKNESLIFLRNYFPWLSALISLIFLIIFLCYFLGFDRAEGQFAFLDTLCALATLSSLVAASRPGINKVRNILSSKKLVFFGSFSYSLYLIHSPLLQIIWYYFIHPLNLTRSQEFVLLLFLGTPIILAVAYIFYLFFELPFLRNRNNLASNTRLKNFIKNR